MQHQFILSETILIRPHERACDVVSAEEVNRVSIRKYHFHLSQKELRFVQAKRMAFSASLLQFSCVSLLHSNLNNPSSLPFSGFPKSLFGCGVSLKLKGSSVCGRRRLRGESVSVRVNASLVEAPVLWAGRICIFYALLKAGLAGSQANPLVSGAKPN